VQKIVYLNGTFLPEQEAMVPVTDRGFIFGDGIYEVIPAYGGRLFRLHEHLVRLSNSLKAIRLADPYSEADWIKMLNSLVEKNGGGEQSIYLQITRGNAPRDHAFPDGVGATVFASSTPLKPVAKELLENGVTTITLNDFRWQNCHIKAISLLPNILLRQQAVDAGAQEAILVRDGVVTEGAASNVFIVKDGVIKTPPKGPYLLPGITRDLILELAAAADIPYEECSFTPEELQTADEIWLSSSTKEILPVTKLDDQTISGSKPGPMWHKMTDLYQAKKQALIAGKTE